jgi:methionyl-tRNA formyltransferase
MPRQIVFMGTAAFACPALSEIVAHDHEVVAVYTRAPRPAGRGMALRLSPVHRLADQLALPVLTPDSLRTKASLDAFAAHQADLAVVIAYGHIIPPALLSVPPQGFLNVHASLLPRWRGAAPIQRAIMAGDTASGVCVMRLEEGLDTGPIAMAEQVAVGPDMTAGDLHDKLALVGADLLIRSLAALERDSLVFAAQAETGATYAKKIEKAECRIDWTESAERVHNHIRGLSPQPGAYFEADFGRGNERIKVLRSAPAAISGVPGVLVNDALTVACGTGGVRLLELQRQGRAALPAADFLRGAPLAAGQRLR